MDISPCIRKAILIIINEFFKNAKNILEKIITKLEKEGFINILIFLYSISCIDLRRNILDLIKNLKIFENNKIKNQNDHDLSNYQIIFKYLNENLLNFQKEIHINDINKNVKFLLSEKILETINSEFKNLSKEENKKLNTQSCKDNNVNDIKDRETLKSGTIDSNINGIFIFYKIFRNFPNDKKFKFEQ